MIGIGPTTYCGSLSFITGNSLSSPLFSLGIFVILLLFLLIPLIIFIRKYGQFDGGILKIFKFQ